MVSLKREIKNLLYQMRVDRITQPLKTEMDWKLGEANIKIKQLSGRYDYLVSVFQKHFETFGSLDKETFEKIIKEMKQ